MLKKLLRLRKGKSQRPVNKPKKKKRGKNPHPIQSFTLTRCQGIKKRLQAKGRRVKIKQCGRVSVVNEYGIYNQRRFRVVTYG